MQEETRDKRLIENHLAGDEFAFPELLECYLKPIYNFLYQITNDEAAAEDLSQETFIKVWKNLKRYDPKKKFRTWLFAIAKNAAFDWLKKKKSLPFSYFTDVERENKLENIADDDFLPDEILERKDLAEELEKILERIPVHYRAILLLNYKEDFSLHEIAEILNEPYNTIKSRHQRGLAKLRELLLSKDTSQQRS